MRSADARVHHPHHDNVVPDPPWQRARLGHVALQRGTVPVLSRGALYDGGAARMHCSGDGPADHLPDVPTVHDVSAIAGADAAARLSRGRSDADHRQHVDLLPAHAADGAHHRHPAAGLGEVPVLPGGPGVGRAWAELQGAAGRRAHHPRGLDFLRHQLPQVVEVALVVDVQLGLQVAWRLLGLRMGRARLRLAVGPPLRSGALLAARGALGKGRRAFWPPTTMSCARTRAAARGLRVL
mmetsp:Transcript_29712/g.79012  ORF Transcript_29712/g.79012 Transcript_29712/m.79012 type:complete len:239 (-) Transcript_29712:13-729(-)